MAERIRVLIVDSSAFVRQELARLLGDDPEIEVVGTAADADFAWRKIRALEPDLVTLDVAMSTCDGLAFLTELMREHPLPVVVVSAPEPTNPIAAQVVALGACAVVSKPSCDLRTRLAEVNAELREKILTAARTRSRLQPRPRPRPRPRNTAAVQAPARTGRDLVVAIGVSTGGPPALRIVLESLPADTPGIVIVQHMPEQYTRGLAERLDQACALRVRQAADGDRIEPGVVLVAAGDHHLQIARAGADLCVRASDTPAVNHHRPSVDVLFLSAAEHVGANALGVILTGMGADGAAGLLAMKRAGASTIAQDEASSVVFGMPKEAISAGAVDRVVPLDQIAKAITGWHARQCPRPLFKEAHGQDSDCR